MAVTLSDSTLLYVLVGGAIGGAARHLLTEAVGHWVGSRFPWGTLLVNVLGSGLIGVCFGAVVTGTWLHAGVMLGFLGSFTTVSSFALQTWLLARNESGSRAMLYTFSTTGLCLLAVTLGFLSGQSLRGGC